jgi:hypothetical protein
MPRNKIKFKSDLQKVVKEASKKAYTASFNIKTNDDDTVEILSERMSDKFAEVYAKEMGPKLADLIDSYIDSQFFDVTGLAVSGSKVVGVIKST